MDGKIYDIPFLLRSEKSDFECRDGEIESCENLVITESSEDSVATESGEPLGFTANYTCSFPPSPDIEFSLLRETLPGWHLYYDQYPSQRVTNSNPSAESWGKIAGDVLASFYAEADDNNLFVSPFLVMAAWKTVDGESLSPSAPVLMIPNSETPLPNTGGDISSTEIDMRIAGAVCSLCHKLSLPEILRDWVGKIASLEILVSKPLTQYQSAKSFFTAKNISVSNFSLSLDSIGGTSIERRVCDDTVTTAWRPYAAGSDPVSLTDFYTFASIPLGDLVPTGRFIKTQALRKSLTAAFAAAPVSPSFSTLSAKDADGVIDYKGRKILWNPVITHPPFSPLKKVMCHAEDAVNPRWIFHPDPYASEYRFTDSAGVRRKLPLKPHPSLYGSYFYAGLEVSVPEFDIVSTGEPQASVRRLNGYIITGKKDAAGAFTDSGLQDLAVGRIIAICRAFRTSGLVATVSPTIYLFTDTGVYLFRESATGLWTDAGLMARYILKSPESVTLFPQCVRFVTADGDTVSIEGTKVKVLSASSSSGAASASITGTASGITGSFVTRPIKLSGAGKLKRLHRVHLRGEFDSTGITLRVLASRDMRTWNKIAERKKGAVVSTFAPSFRFYKIAVEANLSASQSLQGVTIIT